jgi:N-acyl amino acid synthase of PEP-CTERM/exosortase system
MFRILQRHVLRMRFSINRLLRSFTETSSFSLLTPFLQPVKPAQNTSCAQIQAHTELDASAAFNFRKEASGVLHSSLLTEIFALRYEVYCLETHFLSADGFQSGLEYDEYDVCSTHFAAFNLDGIIVATVRLVQPDDRAIFPFQSHCSVFEGFQMPPRALVSEVSRLMVKKAYRRHSNAMQTASVVPLKTEQTHFTDVHHEQGQLHENSPTLLLSIYREMYRHSRQNGIRYWFAAMERPLARSLERMGFRFVPIGPQTDYYGPVTPYMIDLNEVIERLSVENRSLASWFNDESVLA